MNLLLINYEYPPIGGGAGNATHFLAQAMLKLGHKVTVLTSAWKEHRGVDREGDFCLIRLNSKRQHPSMASHREMASFVQKAFSHLPQLVREEGITHAIIFFTIPNGPLGWWLKTKYNIPYIVSLRGGDVPKLVPEIEFYHKILRPIRQCSLRKAHRIVANADGLAKLSMETDPYHVDVIPNGVDTQTFYPAPEHRAADRFDIVFVGRFHRQKNLPLLLSCFKTLLQNNHNNIFLHLVGQGPMEEQLFELAKDLGIQKQLHWYGWTDKKDLLDIYQKCHLMVNPSFYEGLPNAVLEGMASGLPFIVSDVPGNRDLITQECGWIFPMDEPQALSNNLQQAIDQPELCRSMGENARKRVLDHYDWNIVAQRYLDLFESPSRASAHPS